MERKEKPRGYIKRENNLNCSLNEGVSKEFGNQARIKSKVPNS